MEEREINIGGILNFEAVEKKVLEELTMGLSTAFCGVTIFSFVLEISQNICSSSSRMRNLEKIG